MKGKGLIRSTILILVLLGWVGNIVAQNISEAQTAYNEAITNATENPKAAIESMKTCIELCGKIGVEAEDLKVMAEIKIPELYYNLAGTFAKEKDYDKAITTFNEAIQIAKQYRNDEVISRSNNALMQLYSSNAYAIRGEEPEKAIELCNKALAIDSNAYTPWLVLSQIYKAANEDEKFEQAIDKCIEVSTTAKDTRNLKQAQKQGRDYFLSKGAKVVAGNKFADGVPLLEKVIKFDSTSTDAYYYLATANNGLQQWDKAAESANKGIELDNGTPEQKARYFFALGNALKGKGDKENACAAFKNALYPPFEESAKYAIEVELKCN